MKKLIVFIMAMMAIQLRAQHHDWEDPSVLGINKLPYHATLQLPSKWKECEEIVSRRRRVMELPSISTSTIHL